ncbi:MAG: GGDEF domain-containing protein [Alphaproteobacteria bacterium]
MQSRAKKLLEYLKIAKAAAVPTFFLAGALVVRALFPQMPKFGFFMIHYFFFISVAIAIVLSWWFNKTKALFISLVSFLGYLLIYLKLSNGLGADLYSLVFFPAYCFLAPLNLIIFSYLEERGLLTFQGFLKILFLIAQTALVFFMAFYQADDPYAARFLKIAQNLNDFVNMEIFQNSFKSTPIPQVGLTAFLVSFLWFMVKASITGKPMDCGFLTVTITLFFGLHFVGDKMPVEFFLASILIILASIIQDSYNMAFHDHLTGIPGRQALGADLKKLGSRYAVAMADIDFFKKFNDTYGHDVGDQVLRMVASNLFSVGGGGKAYRYGGEEFTILFPGKSKNEAKDYLEEIRQKIEQTEFRLRSKDKEKAQKSTVQVTVSMGVAEKGRVDSSAEDVIKKADDALYKAKKDGRNRVAVG